MKLHLLIPSLFWPDPAFTAIYGDIPLPSLENLLAKSTTTDDGPHELEGLLCSTFNVARQLDWPVAPITLKIDGNGEINTGEINAEDNYWMRADPVHLHIEHDQILLADSRVFKISQEEADQLVETLNRHFRKNGQQISFLPLRPDRWYLLATGMAPAQTHLLGEAASKNIKNLLPYGDNASAWRSLFNEMQMLLHEHPVNQARETRDEVAVNAAWLWGGGVMPKSIASPYTHAWSNDPLTASLALMSKAHHSRLPSGANDLLQHPASGHHLGVLDVLHGKAQYGDAYGWRESLKKLEQNWFEPLSGMLKRNMLSEITITAVGSAITRNFTARSGDLRKFWRRPKPLSTLAGEAR
jgi:hypothetical protein